MDCNARVLGLTKDIDVGLLADARLAAEAMTAALSSGPEPASCLATTADRLAAAGREKAAWEEELSGLSVTAAGAAMEPRHALRELEKAMPADASRS